MCIEIEYQPLLEVLQDIGVSQPEFEAALEEALSTIDECGELPIPEDMPIILAGRAYRVGDVAAIIVTITDDIQIEDEVDAD